MRSILGESFNVEDFHSLLMYVLVFCFSVGLGFFLLARAKRLFLFIKPELLRRNVVTFCISLCFFLALGHLIPDFRNIMYHFGWMRGLLLCMLIVVLDVLLPYNIVLLLTERPRFSPKSLWKQQAAIFLSIVLTTIVVNGIMNISFNGTTRYLKYSFLWSFYLSGFGALIYLFIRQYDIEKRKKLMEQELELARLGQQKTKAELDALHSKINPHFLYNALNSIADLSVTDGRKARSMTISLAELFRYSINYSDSNYSTVKEELEVAKLYLEIEKTRFEDTLFYSIDANENALSIQVPKFILQPIVENAVKHGLKTTGRETRIRIEAIRDQDVLILRIYDNGPAFPEEWNPGYGLKSVYDKLELLFPEQFEIKMQNGTDKYFEIRLKQMKHDSR